jgi:hypothetical protein
VLGHVGGALREFTGLVLGAACRLGVPGGDGVRGEEDLDRRVRLAGSGELLADLGQTGGWCLR